MCVTALAVENFHYLFRMPIGLNIEAFTYKYVYKYSELSILHVAAYLGVPSFSPYILCEEKQTLLTTRHRSLHVCEGTASHLFPFTLPIAYLFYDEIFLSVLAKWFSQGCTGLAMANRKVIRKLSFVVILLRYCAVLYHHSLYIYIVTNSLPYFFL